MQDLSNITTLDLVIVALYLLGMLGIGVYFVRRIQNAGDYYVNCGIPDHCRCGNCENDWR